MNFLFINQLTVVFIYFVSQISGQFINDKDCGLSRSPFIVGGKVVDSRDYPFMVSIQVSLGKGEYENLHNCGGTVLNSRWVLTAAHCITIFQAFGIIKSPSSISLVMGSSSSNSWHPNRYRVETWVINGCYSSMDPLDADIALLMTSREIDLNNSNIRTICLPPKLSEPIGYQMEVIGWGIKTETGLLTDRLQKEPTLDKFTATVHSEDYCRYYQYFRNLGSLSWVIGRRLCLISSQSTSCRGDSGGPSFQRINGRMYQFGITSFMSGIIPFSANCWRGNPVLYTKVSYYLDWILDVIKNQSYYRRQYRGSRTQC